MIQGWKRRVKKNVATSVCYPLSRLIKTVILENMKYFYSDIRILYPAPKISNPNLNIKLRWHKILRLEPRNYFPFCANLDLLLGLEIPGYSSEGFLFFSPLVFTSIILSWGTTSTTKSKILPMFPSTQSTTTYIVDLILELCVG